jgi:hypothetical protein
MTRTSNYDILWTRSEEEARKLYGDQYKSRVSATELNRLRRPEALEERGRPLWMAKTCQAPKI